MHTRQIPSSCRKTARIAIPTLADPPAPPGQRFCNKSVSTGNFQDLQLLPAVVKPTHETITFYSLLKNNHRAAKYIFIRKYDRAPDDALAVRRAAIAQATCATIHRLTALIEKMNDKVRQLTDKRKLIIHHIQGFDTCESGRSPRLRKRRLCAKILLELRLEYLEFYILHESELCADVEVVRQLVTLFHGEQPDNEIRVNFRAIEATQASFPCSDASRAAFERQDRFNAYFERLGEEKPALDGVRQFSEIVQAIKYTTDFRFVYFRESGTTQGDFDGILKALPSDLAGQIEASVEECQKSPRSCGQIIRNISVEVALHFGFSDTVVTSIVFLLLCRHIFSRLYIVHPVRLPPRYDVFIQKADFLRRRSPTQFGDAQLFMPDELLETPLMAFPVEHKYKPAVDSLDLTLFDCNPLDFCTHINETVMMVHEIASHVVAHKAGDLDASQPEHMLNNDQLIDVFLVVALLAQPEQIRNLVCHFDVYVTGLGIPQQLEFSLTTIKAVIHTILSTDVCKQ